MLINHSLRQYAARLASGESVPGGGSACALSGALGTALARMVAELSLRRAGGERAAVLQEILAEARQLQDRLLELVDADARAFADVARVFKLPRDTEEQKAARRRAMQEALREAAVVPLELARLSLAALRLQVRLLDLSTPHAVSDVAVGVLLLEAALRGAGFNIRANLQGIEDEEFVARVERELRFLLAEGRQLSQDIYQQVEKRFLPEKGVRL